MIENADRRMHRKLGSISAQVEEINTNVEALKRELARFETNLELSNKVTERQDERIAEQLNGRAVTIYRGIRQEHIPREVWYANVWVQGKEHPLKGHGDTIEEALQSALFHE